LNTTNIYIKNIKIYGDGDYPCLGASFLYSKFLYYFKINNYCIVESPDDADYIFLNTCGVSEELIPFYTSEFQKYKNIWKESVTLWVFWCLAGVSKNITDLVDIIIPLKKDYLLDDFFPHQISMKDISQLEVSKLLSNDILKERKIFYIQTNRWCVHNCSYCWIKKAIWNVTSKALDEIIYEVQQALESGFDTIHFITDDIGSYGYDIGSNFGELYNKVCEVSPDFSIEISYCEPSEFMKYFDDIKGNITRITSMVYPIQSCNDRILALMNRKYTVKDFFESVKSIRAVHPNIYLINNIIYWYPTESESEFRENLKWAFFFEENAFCLYQKITWKVPFQSSDFLPPKILYKRKLTVQTLGKKYGRKFCF